MLTYQIEELDDKLIEEIVPTQEKYWKEVAGPFHRFPPDVDWKAYKMAKEKKALVVIVGRDKLGGMKAYAFMLITPHPHYACVVASLPGLFMAPEARNGWEGVRLIRMAEETAEAMGAQMFMTHGGVHNKVYRVFEFLEYQDFGRYFVKVLPNGPRGIQPFFKEK